MNEAAQRLYKKILFEESINDIPVFHFKSLENAGLDLAVEFISNGTYKFCAMKCEFYLELV